MKHRTTYIALALLTGALAASCGPKRVELPPAYKASFDYEPRRQGEGAETISIALLTPHWSSTMMGGEGKVDDDSRAFRDALQRALLDYFTVNSFAVSGPFESLANMTFPEKKQADLVLDVELDYAMGQVVQSIEHRSSWDGSVSYTYACDGDVNFKGGLSMTLWEPLSGQRMWTKTISMDGTSVPVHLAETDSYDLAVRVHNNTYRELLDLAFVEVTRQMERYFHPDEVRLVKQQAQDLRDKKVY